MRLQSLLTVLIPTWRFFERQEGSPDLFYRRCSEAGELGPWQRVIPEPQRSWLRLIWNPAGNLALASYGLVDQLVAELEDRGPLELASAEQLPSFRLVRCLVEYFSPLSERTDPAFRYQFKLVSIVPSAPEPVFEELLVSDVYSRC